MCNIQHGTIVNKLLQYIYNYDYTKLGKVSVEIVNSKITLAPNEVSGYSVRFHKNFLILPSLEGPKSSTDNLSIYFRSDSI